MKTACGASSIPVTGPNRNLPQRTTRFSPAQQEFGFRFPLKHRAHRLGASLQYPHWYLAPGAVPQRRRPRRQDWTQISIWNDFDHPLSSHLRSSPQGPPLEFPKKRPLRRRDSPSRSPCTSPPSPACPPRPAKVYERRLPSAPTSATPHHRQPRSCPHLQHPPRILRMVAHVHWTPCPAP